MEARAYLPWLRAVKALRIAVFQMDGDTPTTSSEAVSEASSLSPRAVSRIAGGVALFYGFRPLRAPLQTHCH